MYVKQKGFSLIESVIAVGIIATFAISMTYFSSLRENKVSRASHGICTQTAKATLEKIKSLGVAKIVAGIDIENNEFDLPFGQTGRTGLLAASDEWLKDGDAVWEVQGGNTIVKNYRALLGSMSFLNSLYNRDARYCSTANGFDYTGTSPIELFNEDDFGHLRDLSSTLRIQAFDLRSGALSCVASPLVLMPSGSDLGNPLSSVVTGISTEVGARSDLGFWVTVRTQYRDNTGGVKNCSVSSLFSYPRIPAGSEIGALNINITPSAIPRCTPSTPTVTVDINVPQLPDYDEKAMVLLCRDTSTAVGVEAPSAARCSGGPIRGAFTVANTNWRSCNEVTLCGRPQQGSTVRTGTGIRLSYSNLSFACRMSMEVRLLDAAHNTAATADSALNAEVPASVLACNACTNPYQNMPGQVGWCQVSEAASCFLPPPPPPPSPPSGGCSAGNEDGSVPCTPHTGDGGDPQ